MTERATHLDDLRSRIDRGEYAVDPRALADAILAALRRDNPS